MAYFSPSTKEIAAKIVYYGPGMCGKTTNLQKVHELMMPQMKSELLSVATETDRTIYFDFLPLKLGKIAGFDFQVRVFTVPGQPYYAETRRIVLQGADGVVFVADSQRYMLDQNKDSLLDLQKNLRSNGLDFDSIPLVLQYNKQDLPDRSSREDLDAALNPRGAKVFLASAFKGVNVVETLKYVTLEVFRNVRDGAKSKKPRARKRAAVSPASSAASSAPAPPAPAPPLAAPAPVRANSPAPAPAPVAAVSPSVAQVAPAATRSADPFSRYKQTLPAAPLAAPAASTATVDGSTPLADLVGEIVDGAEAVDVPMPSRQDLAAQEFSNLLVLHHKLVERVAGLESELMRVKNDYQDIKALLGRKLR